MLLIDVVQVVRRAASDTLKFFCEVVVSVQGLRVSAISRSGPAHC